VFGLLLQSRPYGLQEKSLWVSAPVQVRSLLVRRPSARWVAPKRADPDAQPDSPAGDALTVSPWLADRQAVAPERAACS